jgi:hypothetical protein
MWCICMPVVAFVCYILSLGPFYALSRHDALPPMGVFLDWYQVPAAWFAKVPPLHAFVETYCAWWLEITDAPDTTI